MSAQLRVLVAVLGLVTGSVGAAELPGAGQFLVASRALNGPTFAHAVVLIVHHDDSGAMGLIVNRPTRLLAAEALPQLPLLAAYPGRLYLGGPVNQERVWALLRTDTPPHTAVEIFAGVYLTSLTEALASEAPGDASTMRLYVGYAGWGPGQLEGEMALGSWHVAPASAAAVFSTDPADLWRQLVPAPRYQVANDLPVGPARPSP
jgi:putative transcriptional regulator